MNSLLSSASHALSQASESTMRAANKAREASISNLSHATAAMGLTMNEEKLKKVLSSQPVVSSCQVWKRRGGLGKLNSASAWESRLLELRGTTLLYYDYLDQDTSQDHEQHPRGVLDLKDENATVQASMGHNFGAPSPFCLSIKVHVGLTQETKWKLCWDHHAVMMEWLCLLTNAVVDCSVDAYNHALLEAVNPNHPMASELQFLRPPPVYEPKEEGDDAGGGHRLWMTEHYSIRSPTVEDEKDEATKRKIEEEKQQAINNALSVMESLLSEKGKQVKALRSELETVREACKSTEVLLSETRTSNALLQSQLDEARETLKAKEESLAEQCALHEEKQCSLDTAIQKLHEELKQSKNLVENTKKENESIQVELQAQVQSLEAQIEKMQLSHQISILRLEDQLLQAKQLPADGNGGNMLSKDTDKNNEKHITKESIKLESYTASAVPCELDSSEDEFQDCVM